MLPSSFIYGALVVGQIGTLQYIWQTLHGNTRPHRVTWVLWSLIPTVATIGMIREGASWPQILMAAFAGIGPFFVFLASLGARDGVWHVNGFDRMCGAVSLVALLALVLNQRNAIPAIVLSIVADAVAAIPTLAKAYTTPESESSAPFALSCLSWLITLLVVSEWTLANVAFAIYGCLICALITLVIVVRTGPRLLDRSA